MKHKKTAIAAVAVTGASYLSYKAISEDMFKSIFKKRKNPLIVKDEVMTWFEHSNVSKETIRSFDGLNLSGADIHNHDDAPYLIMVHGIWSDKESMYERAMRFDELGYNMLLIDQRASGESEGKYYTYGQKESLDLLLWISLLTEKYPKASICLYVVSMGAASVMMAAANPLPEQVCCLIEDCGYSSLKEVADEMIRNRYHLSFTAIILNLLEKMMKERFGFDYDDVCIKKYLEDNEIPILFIHGEKDEFVPYDMAKILYNHNKGSKKFYRVADAGHTEANNDPEYYHLLDAFIRENMKQGIEKTE